MKNTLKILNVINLMSLFLFIPQYIFGDDIFIFQAEDSFFSLMANQLIICLSISLTTLFVAKKRKIKTTRDGVQIIKQSHRVMRLLVSITFIFCIICSTLLFEEYAIAFILLSFLHSMSILLCSGIIRKII